MQSLFRSAGSRVSPRVRGRTRGLGLLVFAALLVPPAHAQLGVVTSTTGNSSGYLYTIDGATDTELGRLWIDGVHTIAGLLDCVLLENEKYAYVAGFNSYIYVVDVSDPTQPVLATPPVGKQNPIPISNPGEDLAITRDQKYALISDGRAVVPVSVIDLSTWSETSTAWAWWNCTSVDVSEDGAVFVTSSSWPHGPGTLSRLEVSPTGKLWDTGDDIFLGGKQGTNVYTSSSPYQTCVALSWNSGGGLIQSYTYPGLTLVDTRVSPSGSVALCGAIHPTENVLYVRTADLGGAPGAADVQRWTYNHATGALGAAPTHVRSLPDVNGDYYGVEQMSLSSDGKRLYCCDETGAVTILNAHDLSDASPNGSVQFNTPLPANTQGICFPTRSAPLSVELEYWRGRMRPDGRVEIRWRTASEIDNAGFNLFRQPWAPGEAVFQGGRAVLLNPHLLPARGAPYQAADYRWMDPGSQAGGVYHYWLEDVDLHGASTLHGPFAVR